jgi:hypothetical protein
MSTNPKALNSHKATAIRRIRQAAETLRKSDPLNNDVVIREASRLLLQVSNALDFPSTFRVIYQASAFDTAQQFALEGKPVIKVLD